MDSKTLLAWAEAYSGREGRDEVIERFFSSLDADQAARAIEAIIAQEGYLQQRLWDLAFSVLERTHPKKTLKRQLIKASIFRKSSKDALLS